MGSDVTLSYPYYTLTFSLNWNRWQAPVIDQNSLDVIRDAKAKATHISLESKYRFPFLVGGYLAGRYQKIYPASIPSFDYIGQQEYINQGVGWAPEFSRIEGVVGYRLTSSITLKVSYSHSVNEGEDWDDNVFAMQLSAEL